ncbi:hypothetical protein JW835_15420 [bacterium]|nr:hypothetical protein [bacterium]
MSMDSVQAAIEKTMRIFESEDRWECVRLFSSEGLLMAGHGLSPVYGHDQLLEFSFSLIETVKLLGSEQPVKEIVIQGKNRRRLVFHFFESWGEPAVLAAVLHGRKGYKRAMTKLMKLIQNIN